MKLVFFIASMMILSTSYSQIDDYVGTWEFQDSTGFSINLVFGLKESNDHYGKFLSNAIGNTLIQKISFNDDDLHFQATLGSDYKVVGIISKNNKNYLCELTYPSNKKILIGNRVDDQITGQVSYSDPDWAPDGRRLLTTVEGSGQKNIEVWIKAGKNWNRILELNNAHRGQFSNDGHRIGFVSFGKEVDELWIYSFDTQDHKMIAQFKNGIHLIDWGENDNEILFSSTSGAFIVNVQSRDIKSIRDNQPSYYSRYSPAFDLISYTSTDQSRYDVWIYNVKQQNAVNLSNHASPDFNQQVSRKGDIIWISRRDGNPEVYSTKVENMDNVKRLTKNDHRDNNPNFSNNGKQIAWVKRNKNPEIYLMNSDGTNQRNITNSEGNDTNPIFSPDDKEILFLSDRDGKNELFIFDILTGVTSKVLTE